MQTNLDRLFNPKSLAMIGASAQTGKWGNLIFLNILKGNYQGKVFPVNPKMDTIYGYPCYPSVSEIPEPVDLALITTPAKSVLSLIDQCGEKKIPFVVIISANFSETGKEGEMMEQAVMEKAARHGIRVVGPNTMGIYGAESKLHALMPMLLPLPGPVSMFSQSGNVGVQMMDYGQKEGIGFNKFVSSGNEGDLTCVNYISYFANDPTTEVIIGYIEGFDAGTDFLPVVKSVSHQKPIVILKGGRTRAGTQAAASHTGALAGSSRVIESALKQAGVVQAATSLELIDCAKAFSNYPVPKGDRIGIVTRGGGWGVITADACEEAGLKVPALPDAVIQKIDLLLPDYWNRGNPIDLVATIAYDPMPDILKLLIEWDGIDAIIALGAGFQSYRFQYNHDVKGSRELMDTLDTMVDYFRKQGEETDPVLNTIGELVRKYRKPIISVSIGSDNSHKEYLERYGIVSYPTPERAVKVLKHMSEYASVTGRKRK